MKTEAMKPLIEKALSSLPLLFSGIALVISFLSFQLTDVRSVKPVLTLAYRGDAGWFLKNIGSGPALNVIVAEGESQSEWFHPVRVAPLANGEEDHLRWLGQTNSKWLGATYVDIDGRRYTSLTSEDLTSIKSGGVFPKWHEQDIQKQWELEFNQK